MFVKIYESHCAIGKFYVKIHDFKNKMNIKIDAIAESIYIINKKQK